MARVLVVDDSRIDRMLAAGLLAGNGSIEVLFAESGDDALRMINVDPPDVVVTDLIMPGIGGLELVASVVSNHPLIPVVVMSGRGSEEIAVQALQTGAASYVPKRSLADMLLETVNQVLLMARDQRSHVRLLDCMMESECTFQLGNDSAMVPPLVGYLHRTVRQVGLCDEVVAVQISVALEEAITNAIFHGNLELESALRDEDAEQYQRAVDDRRRQSPYKDRAVDVRATVSRRDATFVICDQGPGFDPATVPDPTEAAYLDRPSGRGILLMKTFMDEVRFNSAGNEVTMIKHGQLASSDP